MSLAAFDEDLAFKLVIKAVRYTATFDELGNAGDESSLDSKLRTALLKYTTGDAARQCQELVDTILSEAKAMMRADDPKQIKGRHILHIIKAFYEVKPGQRTTFELLALME